MASANVQNRVGCLGKTFRETRTITADGTTLKDPTLAAAKKGALTTRVSGTAGTLTMDAGHGFLDGQRIDIFWAGGAAYGATIGTVATNSVPFTGAAGDALPDDETAITAMVPQLEAFDVPSADLQSLLCGCLSPAYFVFLEDDDTPVKAIYVDGVSDYVYDVDNPLDPDTPFAADVAKVYLSHGLSSASRQVNALALVN